MPYRTTAINGFTLLVNGQAATDYPHSVPYEASCSFRVWVSLRMNAPQADTLTLHTEVKRADNSVAFSEDQNIYIEPGEGIARDTGTFIANDNGDWVVNFSLTSLNEGKRVIPDMVFMNVSGGGVVLQPGQPYTVQATVTNLSTADGQPVTAKLTAAIEGWVGSTVLIDPSSYTEIYGPAQTKIKSWGFTVLPSVTGSGSIIARVLDPSGNVLAEGTLSVTIP